MQSIEIIQSLLDKSYDFSELEKINSEPFCNLQFFKLLERTNCIGKDSGWIPQYFISHTDKIVDGIMFSFIKTNSYGEYIFDWAWANFYHQNGINYYPKLTSSIPFTPVNSPKVITKNQTITNNLYESFHRYFKHEKSITSAHILFSDEDQETFFRNKNYHLRHSLQYHLDVNFDSFDEYLKSLKKNRRKTIKKERLIISDHKLEIKEYENNFPKDIYRVIYQLYLTTIDKKYSQAYLNEQFFKELLQISNSNLILHMAYEGNEPIAFSLFFKSESTLYGRYWGVKTGKNYQYLHFEMCYYRGIEYCLRKNLRVFEAGAQGEQKLLRGFKPKIIRSLHKIQHPQIDKLIGNFIEEEKIEIDKQKNMLSHYLPVKKLTSE